MRTSAIVFLLTVLCSSAQSAGDLGKFRARLKSGKATTIVCFGDSVTGLYYHTGGRRTYTDMIGIALRKAVPDANVTMINAGISGNTAMAGLKRIERDVLAKKPDLVTVMFGLNDMVRRSVDQYRENLEEIVTRCRAAGAEVLLCTPNAVTDTSSRPTAKLLEYCAAMRKVAEEMRVPLCDTYAAFDELRTEDRLHWRLTMSDAIHPNMGGHRFIAEQITMTILGKPVSLSGTPPPSGALRHVRKLIAGGKGIQVLAMPPTDKLIAGTLKRAGAKGSIEVTTWQTEKHSLAQIETHARNIVRKMKPDLVVIAVPRDATSASEEEFIKAHMWIRNWSLSFGREVWNCAVVHPAIFAPDALEGHRDELIRKLVSAHDLHLIDRPAGDDRSGEKIFRAWFARELTD